jgi:hypothetical protein
MISSTITGLFNVQPKITTDVNETIKQDWPTKKQQMLEIARTTRHE